MPFRVRRVRSCMTRSFFVPVCAVSTYLTELELEIALLIVAFADGDLRRSEEVHHLAHQQCRADYDVLALGRKPDDLLSFVQGNGMYMHRDLFHSRPCQHGSVYARRVVDLHRLVDRDERRRRCPLRTGRGFARCRCEGSCRIQVRTRLRPPIRSTPRRCRAPPAFRPNTRPKSRASPRRRPAARPL